VTIPLLFKTVCEFLAREVREGRDIEGIQTGKEEIE
jgi:hypothetical protein